MGTKLLFSLAYHPQTDGQMKVVTIILGDLLSSLVTEHHSQWDNVLPQVEFSYNDSVNRSTGQSPFQVFYGMQQRAISELRDSEQNATRSASVEDFVEAMKEIHSQVKE
jgi:hypothetical protein